MSTPTSAPTDRARTFRHDLVLHEGPDDLVALLTPFLREGADAGDQLVLLGQPAVVDAMLAAVPEASDVVALREEERQRFAGRDLHRAQNLLASLGTGTRPVRVVNQMPAAQGEQWHEWRRYEAAANVVLAPYRAWGKCAHDVRRLDAGMLADLHATHPLVETRTGTGPSAGFDAGGTRTGTFLDVPRLAVEEATPALALVDPHAADARRAVRDLALRAGLGSSGQETAVLAAHEAVANAWEHGRPPVLLRAWLERPGRLTVAVSDAGPGPHALVGLIPDPAEGTFHRGGMWMVQVLVRDVHHRTGPEGYTVTFSVESAPGQAPT